MSRAAPEGAHHEWPYDHGRYSQPADRGHVQDPRRIPGSGSEQGRRGVQDPGNAQWPGNTQRPGNTQWPGQGAPRRTRDPRYGARYGGGYIDGYGGQPGPPGPDYRDPWYGPARYDDRRNEQRQEYRGSREDREDRGSRWDRWDRGRLRRLMRLRTARAIAVLLLVFFVWLAFSVGQALTAPYGGSTSSRLAEWARGHYLGVLVTFGEWLSYSPPKVGGKPGFSLAVPAGESAVGAKNDKFKPDIPATLKSLAGAPLPGEGQWRVVEKVKGEPAIFTTFLRDATYTSYVNGIVSMDQRLVKFQLRPGGQDPGGSDWGPNTQPWIPPGTRTGLLATFNGGFKLDASQGGFYLNGHAKGALIQDAASFVYYKDGTVKIGRWGRDVTMTPQVVGVRQNLKLIVVNGQVPASDSQNVKTSFGATLGGGYYVWRSGLGITKDGRLIYVYGPALNVQDLAQLLQRAGAVEAMQMDINPEWMSFMYYQAKDHASDPTPANLLPTQQASAYRYYSPYSRDFTAVYSR